jgi:hypothetical protein
MPGHRGNATSLPEVVGTGVLVPVERGAALVDLAPILNAEPLARRGHDRSPATWRLRTPTQPPTPPLSDKLLTPPEVPSGSASKPGRAAAADVSAVPRGPSVPGSAPWNARTCRFFARSSSPSAAGRRGPVGRAGGRPPCTRFPTPAPPLGGSRFSPRSQSGGADLWHGPHYTASASTS